LNPGLTELEAGVLTADVYNTASLAAKVKDLISSESLVKIANNKCVEENRVN
jgi:hypothetical protein